MSGLPVSISNASTAPDAVNNEAIASAAARRRNAGAREPTVDRCCMVFFLPGEVLKIVKQANRDSAPRGCSSDLHRREIDDSYEQLAELLVVVYREARIAVAGES